MKAKRILIQGDSGHYQFTKDNQFYILILLPADYFQVSFVDRKTNLCLTSTQHYQQLQQSIKSQFQSTRQLLQAIINSKFKHFYINRSNDEINIIFKDDKKTNSLYFKLQPYAKDKRRKEFQRETIVLSEQQSQLNQSSKNQVRLNILRCQNQNLKKQLIKSQEDKSEQNLWFNQSRADSHLKKWQKQQEQQQVSQGRNQPFYLTDQLKVQRGMLREPENSSSSRPKLFYPSPNSQFVPFANLFLQKFRVENNVIALLTKNEREFNQVSSKYPIPSQGSFTIQIKIIKSRNSNIYFGLIRQQRRQQKYTCQQKQAISYKLSGGKMLFEDGVQSGVLIPSLKEGESLSLTVNNDQKSVTWVKGECRPIKRKLVDKLQNQALHVFVSLREEGDCVELI